MVSVRKAILVIVVIGFCVLGTACSGNGKDKGQTSGEKSEETKGEPQFLQKDKVHSLEEMVSLVYPTNQQPKRIGAECSVKTAKLLKTPEEAEIDSDQVLTGNDLHYDINTSVPTTLNVSKSSFLLCDVNIKNIDLTSDDMNITMLSLVYLMPEKKELKMVGLPAYFSESVGEENGIDYYHFKLPVNQSMDAKIGWWVNLEECKKENLYLAYAFGGEKELQQYWGLGL